MASTLKQIKVQDKEPNGDPKVDGNGDPVMKDVPQRYKLEFWVGVDGEIEDEAFAYPTLTRPAAGALSAQEQETGVKFTPSNGLKATLKVEQKNNVDVELAK